MDEGRVRTVGVLGVGTMGAGIVQLAAQTGHGVIACDSNVEALEKAQRYVREGLARFADRGEFSEEEAGEHYDRIHWTVNPEEMAEAGAAVEAIVEKVRPKKEAFAALDEILPPTPCYSPTPPPSPSPTSPLRHRGPRGSAGRTSLPRRRSGRRSRCRAACLRATRPSRESRRS